jgi:putative heme-binding domain-containing protein
LKGVIGMAVTLPNDPRGEGVFVATQARILFIVDKDRDGRGDEQRVIASGWPKQLMGGGGGIVDAVGLTMDKEGNLFFGLGVSAYANAYEVDPKTGVAGYQRGSERGTIQRISADFSKRETICTGIRYPVGAAFNALGDLFVTEQEGATWLPNGNPFDELLQIQPGRHYGFPPRHPKHLPDVIDEPSVFDFAPQHQSTCGLAFNEGAQSFGPAWWKGDALTAGEARGKLWRTKLVKTDAGYIAQNQLIAAMSMLAVDVALSPRGDVLVALHSGGPDWGTGPAGAGKIVNLSYTAPAAPQPVLTWNASPTEWRVAFDRELDPTQLRELGKGVKIEQGTYVAAGDRFESLRPGYQAVKDQLAAPRFIVPVLSTTLSGDRRSLIFTTPPRTAALSTAITLPDFTGTSAVPRHAQADVAGDLSGVEAEWTGRDGTVWRGWLPHPDLAVARALTAASAEHAQLFELLGKPGQLKLRGQLDLYEMLQPSIQPGAKLDYERPTERVAVRFESGQSFVVKRGGVPGSSVPNNARRQCFELSAAGGAGQWLPFEIALTTGVDEPDLTATWSTADDRRARAFPLRRILLPWAQAKPEPPTLAADREIPEIKGGNWLRGGKLFYGKATCGSCHKVQGQGGLAGPDLSNLSQRDYASVLRDIREPGAALNPEHLGYAVETNDGGSFAAVLIGGDERESRFADAAGVKTVARDSIKAMHALSASFMPPGLLDLLDATEQRDLLTFLLTTFEPAPLEAKNPPPPRSRAEVGTLLRQLSEPVPALGPALSKMKIVLCAGPKDHGKGEHDYPLWQKRWSRLLALAENVEVETAWIWPSAEQWQNADAVAFFSNNPGWNPEHAAELDAFLARGKGVAYFHFAIDGHDDGPGLANRIGLAIHKSSCKYRHGPVDFNLHTHPLAAGLPPLHLLDETYWGLVGNEDRVKLLASAVEEGTSRPQIWTLEEGQGRVFVSIPGHYNWTFDDPVFRALAFRGLCWAARQPIDRLAELIPIGARIAE